MPDDSLGLDSSTYPDLDPAFAFIGGLRGLGEALARRYETRRGALAYDPDYGLDLRMALHDDLDARGLYTLKAQIEQEAEKDERILNALAELEANPTTQTLTVKLSVTVAEGEYTLRLAVDAVTVTILDLSER